MCEVEDVQWESHVVVPRVEGTTKVVCCDVDRHLMPPLRRGTGLPVMMVGMSLYILFEVVNDVWGSTSKSVMFVRYAPPAKVVMALLMVLTGRAVT